MTVDIKIKEIDIFGKKKYWALLSSILFASDSFPTAQIHPANHFFMPPDCELSAQHPSCRIFAIAVCISGF